MSEYTKVSEYPKAMFHATKPSVMVYGPKQEAELGPEWSRQYIYQPYPRWKYHWSGKSVVVQNAEAEAVLGGGWANSPAAFDVYKSPRTTPTKRADSTKWVDDWCAAGLTIGLRQKVKAELLKAHGAFWKSADTTAGDINSMKVAFDGIATVLFDAGILTEELLTKDIRGLENVYICRWIVFGHWDLINGPCTYHSASSIQNDWFRLMKISGRLLLVFSACGRKVPHLTKIMPKVFCCRVPGALPFCITISGRPYMEQQGE